MKKTIAAIATFATLFAGVPAFASEGTNGPRGNRPEFTPAATCEERNERLDARIERKQAGQAMLEGRHEKFVDRMTQLIADAQAANVDTTELSAAIAELDGWRAEITADYDGLMGGMLELQGTACDVTIEEWVAGMEEVKMYAQAHDAHGKEVRTFLKETLRPAVKAVMEQVHPRE